MAAMIEYNYVTDFKLDLAREMKISQWISGVILDEGFTEGEICYIFCDDLFLHKLNMEFLKHDTYTDILSFDYCLGKQVNGEIYISVERVKENSLIFKTSFVEELHRVMIHGILHFCGYKDSTEPEREIMRQKESLALL